MEWDEPLEEAEEGEGFAGSLAQYVGMTLELNRRGGAAYELRYEDDLVGRLTRPNELMLAETREGRWALRHSRTVSHMEAVDAATGAAVAVYKRAFLQEGGPIHVPPRGRYRLRHDVRLSWLPRALLTLSNPNRWTLRGSDAAVLSLTSSRDGLVVSVEVFRDPGIQEFGLVALLCSYVILLNRASARARVIDGSGAH